LLGVGQQQISAFAMSSKARSFLEDIIAHPDDDAPRLILADWLEDHGDSVRAEFIRVQIERARLPEWDARQVRLRLREEELLAEYGDQWKSELPRIEGIRWDEFRRGFVATAQFYRFAVFRDQAGACWAAAPIEAVSVRWANWRDAIESIAPVAGLRELSITGKSITGRFHEPRNVDRLANSPLLSTLRVLKFDGGHLGNEGFCRLLASPHLGNLTALHAPHNSIGNEGIRGLLDAASLTSLAELDLSASSERYGQDPIITGAGLEALATWPGMARMRSLKLSENAVGVTGCVRCFIRREPAT
jgi:uncharacterized protein (TIGR02996 family)